MAGNTQQNQVKQPIPEQEFLRRVLGNLNTGEPAKVEKAKRDIEARLRVRQ